MVSMLIQHTVKDFAAWKIGFDAGASLRSSFGGLTAQIFRDASHPNKVTVLNKWSSLEAAQKFVQSPELKAAMEKAGVEGVPTVTFLTEV